MHVVIHCPRYAPLTKDLYDCTHDFRAQTRLQKFNYMLNFDDISKILLSSQDAEPEKMQL